MILAIGKEYMAISRAVVACGDTLEAAMETVRECAKQIEGYYIDIFADSFEEADCEIDKLKKFGIKVF